jgi:hypothetical protein
MVGGYRLNTEWIRSHLIEECRKHQYLSQILRCSDDRVARLLAGKSPARADEIKILADALGTTMEELLVPTEGQRTA